MSKPYLLLVALVRAIVAGCVLLCLAAGAAEAEVEHEGTFWTGYMSSWWFDPSWALWFDTHYNVDTFFVARGGISHRFDVGPIVTGGYAFLLLNPDFERYEHRPWAQVFLPYRFNDRWSLSGRFRMDFRFLESLDRAGQITSGWDFVFRTRWQTTLTRRFKPISLGQPLVQVAHEILLNAASDPHRDVMDQNRVSLLFGLEMEHVTIRVGYMNRYLPNARGGNGLDEHAALVWFTQSVDLYKRRQGGKAPKTDLEDFPEFGGN